MVVLMMYLLSLDLIGHHHTAGSAPVEGPNHPQWLEHEYYCGINWIKVSDTVQSTPPGYYTLHYYRNACTECVHVVTIVNPFNAGSGFVRECTVWGFMT